MKAVLIFAYYSYNDPVFQSAVLPYFTKLDSPIKNHFVLLTWEQDQFALNHQDAKKIKEYLKKEGIIWYSVKWHSGRFKLLKKAYDFFKGIFLSLFLIIKYKANTIYSEGFPGAVIAHFISVISGCRHIIHTFEPHADYMKESGVWSENSWEYKLLKKLEIPIANHAATIITATEAYKKLLIQKGIKSKIIVLPSCIDTDFYSYKPLSRKKIRNELNIEDDQIVIAYLGKMGGMYMEEELFEFFKKCMVYSHFKFYFFLFTKVDNDRLNRFLHEYRIPKHLLLCKYLNKDEVPHYLSAADFGFCGVRPIESRRFSSPIKNGEYWACGLPVVIPAGISDDFLLVQNRSDTGYMLELDTDEKNLYPDIIKWLEEKHHRKNIIVEASRCLVIESRDLKGAKKILKELLE